MTRSVIVMGAGGHAVVIAEALLESGLEVIGFTDVDAARHGLSLLGLPVLGADDALERFEPGAVVLANGIGGVRSSAARRSAQQRLEESGWRFATVRHPAAIISRFARVGDGAQVLARSVIQPGVSLDECCIVNTAAVVEHDSVIGSWTHVASGAVICGNVRIGKNCHVGAGAVVRQGLSLGDGTVIGAGAVVVKDHAGGGLLVGVPARCVESRI